ncbi:MAG: arylesterase [Parvibaculum sp.]|nr:arylesterase [Parvibaculum sp.]
MRYGHWAPLCKFFGTALMALSLAAAAPARADERPLTIVALGDSLTAGYLLGPDEGFPEVLERALHEAGHENVKVANAGVSGDTTTGGRARLDWAVGAEADAVIVELGANDALRGVDPAITRENLTEIVSRLKERGLPILLAGMYAPPNLGSDYGEAFNAIYPALARKEGLVFYPFFLDGVAGESELNMADGMHPTADGIHVIVERILPYVEELIARAKENRAGEAKNVTTN